MPGYDFSAWTAFVGLPGMAPEVVARIHAAMAGVLQLPDVVERLAASGLTPQRASPGELKALIEAEVSKWTRLAADYKIQAD